MAIVFNASWIKLLNPIGEGAFSRVYEGLYTNPDTNDESVVAIKILKKNMLKCRSDCLRFIKEAKIMTKIIHRCLLALSLRELCTLPGWPAHSDTAYHMQQPCSTRGSKFVCSVGAQEHRGVLRHRQVRGRRRHQPRLALHRAGARARRQPAAQGPAPCPPPTAHV
jgi:hypothetical protein